MIETIIGIVVGLIITVAVARYYYRLSVRHRLSAYVLQAFRAMPDVDPDIRKDLTVEFHGAPVRNLTILELLIVNEGTHSIRDCAEPLAVHLPADVTLLDVTVPYVSPEGRRVVPAVKSNHSFEYDFSILNPREYFLTKIIADGPVDLNALSITIAADNLPPRLKAQVNNRIETSKDTLGVLGLNLTAIATAVFFGLYMISLLSLAAHIDKGLFPAWLNPPMPYPISMLAVITVIYVILATVICLGFILAIVFGGTFPPSRRYLLPASVKKYDQPIKAGLGLFFSPGGEETSRD
jgi:hypothetical protein